MEKVLLAGTISKELSDRLDKIAEKLNLSKSDLIEIILAETVECFHPETKVELLRRKFETNETLKSLQKDFLYSLEKIRNLANELLDKR